MGDLFGEETLIFVLEKLRKLGVLCPRVMVGEGNTSNGKRNEYIAPAVLRWSEAAQNGCSGRSDIDCTDGSSSGGLQTYKRQKRRKRSLEAEPMKDGYSVQAGTQLADEVCELTSIDIQRWFLLFILCCFFLLLLSSPWEIGSSKFSTGLHCC